MGNNIYTYKNVKNKIKESGLTNAINEMFGRYLTCDKAVMFGEKPIDDKLLYEIGNVVCLATKAGKLTITDMYEVMAPVYELHSKIDNNRFDRMAEKDRTMAYKTLSNDKVRGNIDKFVQEWGSDYTFLKPEYDKYVPKRKATKPLLQNNILPDIFSICGVYPRVVIEMEKDIGQYGSAAYSIKYDDTGKKLDLDLELELFLNDSVCANRVAIEVLSTIAHKLHHCSQFTVFYDIRMQHQTDFWCVSPSTGLIPPEVIWGYSLCHNHPIAGKQNPIEQEAYTVEGAFKYCLNRYYNADGDSERKAVVASLKNPFDESRKDSIDNIVRNKYNDIIGLNYCTDKIRYR